VLLKELAAYYEQGASATLPELPVQYADYAAWQREWLQGSVLEQQLNYWRERLQGAPAVLELATDYPRPALHRYRGATLGYQLDAALSNEMQTLSRREGVTLLMLLLGSLQLLLSRYTGAQDISIGVPIAGRNRVESEGLVGLFLNTLVLRTEWSGNPTFASLLAKVREVALGAYAHQELPFEKLVEELQPERDLSRTPLFQVMLVLQNALLQMPPLTELEVGKLEVATRSTNYDLTVSITETEAGLQVLLDYNALLFKEERMQRLLRHWERLLQSIVATPNSSLTQLQWLTAEEREQIVYGWNQT
jgi:non-ribosomal peptide synthetase component F